jgi:lipopolysaccharide transport system permease protein
VFGLLWAIIYPFLFLGLYALVYSLILRVKLEQRTTFDYVLIIFAGLIPFIGFSEALSPSAMSVVGNKGLLKNTMFPIELLPVKAVITSSVSMAVGMLSLLILLWFNGNISPLQLAALPLFILQIVFSLGLAWILAALTVFFRDIAQALGIITLFLMLVSPIGYTRDMIPHALMPLVYPNPLFYMIEVYREVLVFHVVPWNFLAAFVCVSLATFILGYGLFNRLKPVFSDYV